MMVEPSSAVFAIDEPDRVANTVPPATATSASRPGTLAISFSTASIARTATPVWNNISPISTNMITGASE